MPIMHFASLQYETLVNIAHIRGFANSPNLSLSGFPLNHESTQLAQAGTSCIGACCGRAQSVLGEYYVQISNRNTASVVTGICTKQRCSS
jgi:hypothetical protein